MQIPENPFEINELYQKAVEDIATDKLKSKSRKELLEMRMVLVSYHELNKSFSNAMPFISMVDNQIAKRESAFTNGLLLWAAIIAAIFAVIAAWPIVRDWIPAFRREDKGASFQSPQSNSAPSELTIKPAARDGAGTNH